jgi:GT2 family glycosyltransferase
VSGRALVVVSTYNQLPSLRLCLRGLLRQASTEFSIAVADDGSREETRDFVRAFARTAGERGIPVAHVWQEDVGFRKARILNEAVRRGGEASLVAFLDGDCVAPPEWVGRHLAAHEPGSFHVGGVARLSEEASAGLTEADVDEGRLDRLRTAEHARDSRVRARKSRWGTLLRLKHRPKVFGGNMAFDRSLFVALNGFDERFEGFGLEDTDLRDRAMRMRPRPRVKNLYGTNDVFHLWHPTGGRGRSPNRDYYETARPVRCERGLAGGGA